MIADSLPVQCVFISFQTFSSARVKYHCNKPESYSDKYVIPLKIDDIFYGTSFNVFLARRYSVHCLFNFQGTVLFWDDKPRGKGKEREIFLFEKVLINARKREDGKRYICKFAMKV